MEQKKRMFPKKNAQTMSMYVHLWCVLYDYVWDFLSFWRNPFFCQVQKKNSLHRRGWYPPFPQKEIKLTFFCGGELHKWHVIRVEGREMNWTNGNGLYHHIRMENPTMSLIERRERKKRSETTKITNAHRTIMRICVNILKRVRK